MSLKANMQELVGKDVVIETATVSEVGAGEARVKRAGQTNETRLIPVADGLTVLVDDVVQVIKFNGNINTALIVRKIR